MDRLLERALDGHHQSLEEILTRIDGDPKSNGPAVKVCRNTRFKSTSSRPKGYSMQFSPPDDDSTRPLKRPGTCGPRRRSLVELGSHLSRRLDSDPCGVRRPYGTLRPVRAAVSRASVAGALARSARQRQELSLGDRNPSDEPLQRPARTRILGGSLSQSEQIYEALQEAIRDGRGRYSSDADTLDRLLKSEVIIATAVNVSLLAASPTSVRGPHVPSLKLDEVDEIDPDIRESAMGMAMEKHGCRSSVLMTSTWHRVAGPMAELMERGRSGAFPVDTFCIFEALETCPDERSGPNYEKCPECPLMRWCHSDRDSDPHGPSQGEAIERPLQDRQPDSKSQSSQSAGLRERLSMPSAQGLGRSGSRRSMRPGTSRPPPNTTRTARSTWRSIRACTPGPSGFRSGQRVDGQGHTVNVFADYFAEGLSAETNAQEIREKTRELCGSRHEPASASRWTRRATHARPSARRCAASIERAGVLGRNGLESWPVGKKSRRAPAHRGPTPIGRSRPSTSRSILAAGA